VRYDVERASGTKIRVGATLGLDRSRGVGVDSIAAHKIAARAMLVEPLGGAMLRVGVDLALDAYVVEPASEVECPTTLCEGVLGASTEAQLSEAFRYLFPDRSDLAIGGFVDATIALGERATLTPGLRVDAFFSPVPRSEVPSELRTSGTALAVDPRLVGRFELTPWLRVLPGVGMASQPPGFAPIPGMQIGGLPGGLQRSLQTSFGAEAELGPIELRSTVFRQAIFGLTDPIGGDRGGGFGTSRFLGRSTGDAYGLELALRGALSRDVFVLAAYTLSRTDRIKDGERLPSAYDRTHVAQLALLFDLGRQWKLGTRSLFYTGFPAEELNPYERRSTSPERVRPFYRLDLRLSKRWLLGRGAYWGIAADFQNALLAREIIDVTCEPEGCKPREIGPITIPTLAIEAGF
jgi:outer membrane receptor protein involved in Fe transport